MRMIAHKQKLSYLIIKYHKQCPIHRYESHPRQRLGAEEEVVVSVTAEELTQTAEVVIRTEDVTRTEVVVGIEDVVVARSEAVIVARPEDVQTGTTSSVA